MVNLMYVKFKTKELSQQPIIYSASRHVHIWKTSTHFLDVQ